MGPMQSGWRAAWGSGATGCSTRSAHNTQKRVCVFSQFSCPAHSSPTILSTEQKSWNEPLWGHVTAGHWETVCVCVHYCTEGRTTLWRDSPAVWTTLASTPTTLWRRSFRARTFLTTATTKVTETETSVRQSVMWTHLCLEPVWYQQTQSQMKPRCQQEHFIISVTHPVSAGSKFVQPIVLPFQSP